MTSWRRGHSSSLPTRSSGGAWGYSVSVALRWPRRCWRCSARRARSRSPRRCQPPFPPRWWTRCRMSGRVIPGRAQPPGRRSAVYRGRSRAPCCPVSLAAPPCSSRPVSSWAWWAYACCGRLGRRPARPGTPAPAEPPAAGRHDGGCWLVHRLAGQRRRVPACPGCLLMFGVRAPGGRHQPGRHRRAGRADAGGSLGAGAHQLAGGR